MVREMWAEIAVPAPIAALHRQGPFVSVGARGQKAVLHRHGEFWFAHVHGAKRWWCLLPLQRIPFAIMEGGRGTVYQTMRKQGVIRIRNCTAHASGR